MLLALSNRRMPTLGGHVLKLTILATTAPFFNNFSISGAPSLRACLVFKMAFLSPISYHAPVFGFCLRNLPGGFKFLIFWMTILANIDFSCFGVATYSVLRGLMREIKYLFPGWWFILFPLPDKTSWACGLRIPVGDKIFLVVPVLTPGFGSSWRGGGGYVCAASSWGLPISLLRRFWSSATGTLRVGKSLTILW